MDSNGVKSGIGENIPSPQQAVEFLSRPWSTSSTAVIQALYSYRTAAELRGKSIICREEPGEIQLAGDRRIHTAGGQGSMLGRCLPRLGKWLPRKISFELKRLLRGSLIRRYVEDLMGKRKEKVRVHTAHAHAALSVAGVAAAIATLSAKTTVGTEPPHKAMHEAIASAAALVAARCVEVAESIGAPRWQVASVLDSALAARTAGDIRTLTAAAATSLRAASTLESRRRKAARGLLKHFAGKYVA